tara:strand:+ start:229 stop:693 length:465 start_codon:yes stop_codon:yes gene_type:complete
MANPFPFVAASILTAAELNGIGASTASYTPTSTGVTIGNGTLTGNFGRINKLIYGSVKLALGSTTAITGIVTFSLPVTAATNSAGLLMGNGYYYDNSSGETYVGTSFRTNATTLTPFVTYAAFAYAVRSLINATTPVVYAAGDEITYEFMYEAA